MGSDCISFYHCLSFYFLHIKTDYAYHMPVVENKTELSLLHYVSYTHA